MGTVTCPDCQHKQEMEIPQGKCLPFYICEVCKKEIQAKKQCCVFCEYGDKACAVGHKEVQ